MTTENKEKGAVVFHFAQKNEKEPKCATWSRTSEHSGLWVTYWELGIAWFYQLHMLTLAKNDTKAKLQSFYVQMFDRFKTSLKIQYRIQSVFFLF